MISEVKEHVEALRRLSAYQADFAEWERLANRIKQNRKRTWKTDLASLKALEEAMRRKWKVHSPFPPPSNISLQDWDRPRMVSPLIESVELISPFAITTQGIISSSIKSYDPLRLELDYESFRRIDGVRKATRKGGKHLCFLVDLEAPKKVLLKELEGYYQSLMPMLQPSAVHKRRKKPTATVDMWQVYDLRHGGMVEKDITRMLLKTAPEAPHVSNRYTTMYNAVVRALRKAEHLISTIQPTLPTQI